MDADALWLGPPTFLAFDGSFAGAWEDQRRIFVVPRRMWGLRRTRRTRGRMGRMGRMGWDLRLGLARLVACT